MSSPHEFNLDDKLESKGKVLITFSMLLLALELTGATVKEANTFILKIEFSNQHGLVYLLISAVLYMLIRYHNYAEQYHKQLYDIWTERMMRDIYCVSSEDDGVYGLLQGAILPIWKGCGVGTPINVHYEVSGLFRRRLSYNKAPASEMDMLEFYTLDLCKWTSTWNRMQYLKLIYTEFKYQFNGFLKYREHLDIIGPYLIGVLALCSYFPWNNWMDF